ncbi:hypothetical protein ASD13_06085 [Microbacterium sp. Root1433D1]|uniref:DUF2087 domain-containing protein n=1 Tax=Microbacterium sp. Root1433D1 TaxID=1736463 RepID=UPI0006FAC1FA|nr:DUF2087 domain-containing protein [Microbacterium sp. Root1433D1]KQY75813.1 hypothetical protein ASD13_06085 [Microbacterium sp. Root1433D1]
MSDVRAMLACLANEEVARVFASIVLHVDPDDIPQARKEKAVEALSRSGLITAETETLALNSAGIRAELAGIGGKVTSDPLQRWLDESGRIRQYPRRANEREMLLTTIGDQAINAGERLTEAEVNSRLERYTSDVPTLRRYLVVHRILARENDGSRYWRP